MTVWTVAFGLIIGEMMFMAAKLVLVLILRYIRNNIIVEVEEI